MCPRNICGSSQRIRIGAIMFHMWSDQRPNCSRGGMSSVLTSVSMIFILNQKALH